ncbi:MAG: GUN4 domain-containing protein [Scytonema sp. PMC 1069.18]|nr:GUN4 domain-containing protein [Scytonema sp. PMC 1069.18]MEC4881047.1 GUN4 domain-containing protein [Scytonema sp. PMC 1070.18]
MSSLLSQKQWENADRRTTDLMLYIAGQGQEQEGYFTQESIERFSCPDLRRIDELWVDKSKGHFGFSVQKQILTSMGIRDYKNIQYEEYERLGKEVGWYEEGKGWLTYTELKFDEESSKAGHLPAREDNIRGGCAEGADYGSEGRMVCFDSRAATCQL